MNNVGEKVKEPFTSLTEGHEAAVRRCPRSSLASSSSSSPTKYQVFPLNCSWDVRYHEAETSRPDQSCLFTSHTSLSGLPERDVTRELLRLGWDNTDASWRWFALGPGSLTPPPPRDLNLAALFSAPPAAQPTTCTSWTQLVCQARRIKARSRRY